jgi:DNA replication protein DnaC
VPDLSPLLEHLGLPHAAALLPAWLDRAAREEVGYAEFLQGLLDEEATARANARTQRRLREAAFPFAASIEQFDFRFRPDLKRQVVLRYLDPTFVEQARSLALIGAPGLGKTMLAVCVATKHVQLGATARFVTAQHLANQLGRVQTRPAASACSSPCSPATCSYSTNSATCPPTPASALRCTSSSPAGTSAGRPSSPPTRA